MVPVSGFSIFQKACYNRISYQGGDHGYYVNFNTNNYHGVNRNFASLNRPGMSAHNYAAYRDTNDYRYENQENIDFSLDYDVKDGTRSTRYPRSEVYVVPNRGKTSNINRNPRYPLSGRNRWEMQQTFRYSVGNFQNDSYYGVGNTRQYPRRGGYPPSQRGKFSDFRGSRITCFTCGEEFTNKTALFAHRYEAHNKRNYYCPVCNKEFGSMQLMKEHEKTHTMQACPECPEVFRFKESLSAHQLHAHQKLVTSDKSGFHKSSPVAASTPAGSFSESTQDSGIHIKSESHACPHCIKIFDSEEKLEHHTKIHTDLQSSTTNAIPEPQLTSKGFQCPFCVKSYSTRRELALHLDSAHTKTFYCRKCPAEFTSQTDLDDHMNVHA